ncbi:hypothetical protein COBT_002676 [Conglomerata obtusa]
MQILKRDNTLQPFNTHKITNRLLALQRGIIVDTKRGVNINLPFLEVNVADLVTKVEDGICDRITTVQIDDLSADLCASMCTIHPDYGTMAARITVSNLHKQTLNKFSEKMKIIYKQNLLADDVYDVIMSNTSVIDDAVEYANDYNFNYFGLKTLMRSYLLKVGNEIVERPQDLFMRVTLGIHKGEIESVIRSYRLMSQRYFIHATPTLFNAGTRCPQMSSCFLLDMEDDSIQGIYSTLSKCAVISKNAGGIGVHMHKIRAKGSLIRGTGGTSNGIVPMLKVFDSTAKYVDQGGNKRPGSIAVYLEPWHADIFEFLDLRKNTGKDEIRARDLFLGLWVPDLFMQRVEKDMDWSLFCPDDAYKIEIKDGKEVKIRLYEVYGKEFNEMYERLEKDGKANKKIKAQHLWKAIVEAQIETGNPYILYKDSCNEKNNQKNLGTLKGSNLCTEIMEFTSPDEIAVCNLASIGLPMFVTKIEEEKNREENINELCNDINKKSSSSFNEGINNIESDLKDDHLQKENNDENNDNNDSENNDEQNKENNKENNVKNKENNDKNKENNINNIKENNIKNNDNNDDNNIYKHTNQVKKFKSSKYKKFKQSLEEKENHNMSSFIDFEYEEEVRRNTKPIIPEKTEIYIEKIKDTEIIEKEKTIYKTEDGSFYIDYKKIEEIAGLITNNLNKIIDNNFYPTPETKLSNLRHRPIGIGVQGLADVFAILKIPFESEEARKINRNIFEHIYYGAIKESNNLAKKYGTYESYKGSPMSEGKLQFDLWGVNELSMDWEPLRKSIKEFGLRNSLLLAPMPTASTSQILGFNECIEPFTSNIYSRRTLAGEFQIINQYLLKDLVKNNLWSLEMKNLLIQHEGSIQNIQSIPKNLKEIYKTAWEIKMKSVIDLAADRSCFIDQSQSLNLFVAEPTYSKITSMHFYGWKKGLKTGMYYLRTKPISTAIKFTVDKEMVKEMEEGFVCVMEEGCRSCSG